jgi:hypothetical protein
MILIWKKYNKYYFLEYIFIWKYNKIIFFNFLYQPTKTIKKIKNFKKWLNYKFNPRNSCDSSWFPEGKKGSYHKPAILGSGQLYIFEERIPSEWLHPDSSSLSRDMTLTKFNEYLFSTIVIEPWEVNSLN